MGEVKPSANLLRKDAENASFRITCSQWAVSHLSAKGFIYTAIFVKLEEVNYIAPPKLAGSEYYAELMKIGKEAMDKLIQDYDYSVYDAQLVLPLGWAAEIIVTAPILKWKGFCESVYNYSWELKELKNQIREQLSDEGDIDDSGSK